MLQRADKRIKEIAKNQPNFKEATAMTQKQKKEILVVLDYNATVDGNSFKGSEGKNTQLTFRKRFVFERF
jgi:trigger factor